jgi:hypothetical protein
MFASATEIFSPSCIKEDLMPDIRAVGKPIPYSDDNPVSNWIENLREQRKAHKREPRNDAERKLLARWLGYRGRGELERIVGRRHAHCTAMIQMAFAADHLRTEAGHAGAIQQANDATRVAITLPTEFETEYGFAPAIIFA